MMPVDQPLTFEEAKAQIELAFAVMDRAIVIMDKVLDRANCSPGKAAIFCLLYEHDADDLARRITRPAPKTRVILVPPGSLPLTPAELAEYENGDST